MDGFPDMSAAKSAVAQGSDADAEGPERKQAGRNRRDNDVPHSATRSRPVIQYCAGQPHEFADIAEEMLLEAGAEIFQRAEQLVRPGFAEVSAADNRTTIVAGLYAADEAAVMEELARVAIWTKFDGRSKSWVNCDPPSAIIRVLAARRGRWKLRPISGIITCPTLRPDGTVVSAAGYDAVTRLYHLPDASIDLSRMPANPTREDALRALAAIDELCGEKPIRWRRRSIGFSFPVALIDRTSGYRHRAGTRLLSIRSRIRKKLLV